MIIRRALILGSAWALVGLAPMVGLGAVEAQQKPRVAVIAFKNPTGWWGRELGASAASQLTTRLVNGGAFNVVERDRVKDILDEWYLGQSGAVSQTTAAPMGNLKGVEYLITGEFKSFNIRQRGGSMRIPGTRTTVGGTQWIADSAINVRAINVATGEVVAAAESKGSKNLGQGGQFGGTSYSSITTSSAWNPTIAEDALGEALDTISTGLMNQRGKFPTAAAPPPAASPATAIAGVAADGSIYIDQGQNSGITVGRRFHVLRVVDVIKDSQGKVLDNVTKQIGTIEVTQVLARSAICKVVEGKPEPKDLLEPVD